MNRKECYSQGNTEFLEPYCNGVFSPTLGLPANITRLQSMKSAFSYFLQTSNCPCIAFIVAFEATIFLTAKVEVTDATVMNVASSAGDFNAMIPSISAVAAGL